MMDAAFLISATPRERRALLASMLGWMLDGMDVTLYAMVMSELMRSLRLTPAEAGLLASVTLISSALGGVVFGLLADRYGRRAALILSILVYSVFTAACGLSRGVIDLAIFRVLLGLGMGGEWATGAALVAETWRAEHRAKAMGLMQSGFAVGYALAALVTQSSCLVGAGVQCSLRELFQPCSRFGSAAAWKNLQYGLKEELCVKTAKVCETRHPQRAHY